MFTNGTWNQLHPAETPPAAHGASIAYDPLLRLVVLFEGGNSSLTWGFQAGNWANLTTSVVPPAVTGAAMAFDPADGYIVMYGGESSTGRISNGTWVLR
jgi:hypothetical protein